MKNNLASLLDQLEHYIPKNEFVDLQVSQSTVGWQIEHSLLTINGIITAIQNSNPIKFRRNSSIMKWMILATKKIPRGKAKAPKVVVPKEFITRADLEQHLAKARDAITTLELISKDHFFTHPYFGDLKKKQTILFLEIHTHHHLKIIRDIVRTAN
ncbi:MAG: hypothetical protein RLZZ529_1487 [Bacteroidota bacterium]|jgi:Protein of unknown function (DUF1569)